MIWVCSGNYLYVDRCIPVHTSPKCVLKSSLIFLPQFTLLSHSHWWGKWAREEWFSQRRGSFSVLEENRPYGTSNGLGSSDGSVVTRASSASDLVNHKIPPLCVPGPAVVAAEVPSGRKCWPQIKAWWEHRLESGSSGYFCPATQIAYHTQ